MKPETSQNEGQSQTNGKDHAEKARRKSPRKANAKGKEGLLTPKQEAFVAAYIETNNAMESYRRAYDASGMSVNALGVEAHRLLNHPNVSLKIDAWRKKISAKHEITLESITKMLIEDRTLARTSGQSSAAIQAALGLAKLHGLVIDKSDNKNQNTGTVTVTWDHGHS